MKITELIAFLEDVLVKHGDLECVYDSGASLRPRIIDKCVYDRGEALTDEKQLSLAGDA